MSAARSPWMVGPDARPAPWLEPGEIFSPKSLAGCALWLRADLGVTLNGSTGTVSAWADQSGNGRNTSQATASQQPTYSAANASYAGRATLAFDDSLAQTLNTASFSQAQPSTIVVCGHSTSSAQSGFCDSAAGAGNSPSANFVGVSSTSGLQTYAGTFLTSPVTTALASPAATAAVFDGASSALFINASGTAVVSGNAGTNASAKGYGIGGDKATSGASGANVIAEVAIYARALASAELAQLFAYFAQRYSLSGVS